jgi:hypothetical protein
VDRLRLLAGLAGMSLVAACQGSGSSGAHEVVPTGAPDVVLHCPTPVPSTSATGRFCASFMPIGEEYVFDVGRLINGFSTKAQLRAKFTAEYSALQALDVPRNSAQLAYGVRMALQDLRGAVDYTAGRSSSTEFRLGNGLDYVRNSCNFQHIP